MLLMKYGSPSDLQARDSVIKVGGCKVKKEFITKVFDEELDKMVDIHVKPGFYSYRTLNINKGAWAPTQITFSLDTEAHGIEEGWLYVDGRFFNNEYFELKNIWSVEAYGYGVVTKLIEDVDEEKAQGVFDYHVSVCTPVEGVKIILNLSCAGEIMDWHEIVHENDKFGASSAEEAIHLYPDFEFIEDSLEDEELPFWLSKEKKVCWK